MIRNDGTNSSLRDSIIEILFSVICPIHSVCVPLQWGVKLNVSKLHGPPFLVSPMKLLSEYGFALAFGTLYVLGWLPLKFNGIDTSSPLKTNCSWKSNKNYWKINCGKYSCD